MTFLNNFIKFLKGNKINENDVEDVQYHIILSFILFLSLMTTFIFSVAHFFFFERIISYVLFSFFILLSVIFILYRKTLNYKLFSTITILFLTAFFILITIIGAGNKSGLMWGLTYPVFVAFMTKYRNYNIYSVFFLFFNLIVFFVPNDFDFWAKYTPDIIMRYLFAYILIYFLIELYLRLKQQIINKIEKELIETKHKLLEKENYLSSLSYEIRTPLNNIAGIINHERDKVGEDVIEEIELSVSNLASTLNKIPQTEEDSVFHLSGKKIKLDLNKTIYKLINLFNTETYSKLKFNLFLNPDIPKNIIGDRINFMQLLISSIDFLYLRLNKSSMKINIVSEFNDSDDTIHLTIETDIDSLIFPNNIDTHTILNNEKDLKIIKKLADTLNSDFTIRASDDKFSLCFDLKFPKAEDNLFPVKQYDFTTTGYLKIKKVKLEESTVLVVEDDVINSKVMTLNIQKYVNKILFAENGKEALEKFAESKIDIILMDIRMPLMDGFKTTEKIREAELGTGYHVPIIAVTANASSEVKKKCFEVGMNDYTTKPTNYKLLLKKMKKLLEE